MKDDPRQNPDSAEDRDALRTAYVFGELDETEAARFEVEMETGTAEQLAGHELLQLKAVLAEGHGKLCLPPASNELRKQVLDRLGEPIQRNKPVQPKAVWWNRRRVISVTFAGVTAVCLMLALLPVVTRREWTESRAVAVSPGDGPARTSIAPDADGDAAEGGELVVFGDGKGKVVEIGELKMEKFGRSWRAGAQTSSRETLPGRWGVQKNSPSAASGPRPQELTLEVRGEAEDKTFRNKRLLGRPAASGLVGGQERDLGWTTESKSGVKLPYIAQQPTAGQPAPTTPQAARSRGQTRLAVGLTRPDRRGGRVLKRERLVGPTVTHDFGLTQAVPATTGGEQYEALAENSFLAVDDQAVSTFSIDVDTASYANVRRFLMQGRLPPPAAVRIEEMINYFSYHDPVPQETEPFGVTMEVAACPWTAEHQLVRIALKGKSVPRKERPPCNLVFLLDVSGSMSPPNKLPLLQQAMKLLTGQLTENDRVAIVTYAGNAGLRLDSISGDQHGEIRRTIESLSSGGSTHGSAGIRLAYEKAEQYFQAEGINRVILATDGDLNVGVTQDDALVELIKSKAQSGVFLTVLGFGDGNLKDAKLEKLADNGNGTYAYIDNLREARRVLVEQVAGSLVTIAKDVKIKVEFNPTQVHAYRLIGYENRLMTPPEFDDDRKDAGEIGAGHSVTALYQIAPVDVPQTVARLAQGLKYQQPPEPASPPLRLTEAAHSGELLTLSLRYKQPDGAKSTLREFALKHTNQPFSTASQDFRFSSAVAAFGMLLRGSQFRGQTTFDSVEKTAVEALGSDPGGYRTELVDLVRRAAQVSR